MPRLLHTVVTTLSPPLGARGAGVTGVNHLVVSVSNALVALSRGVGRAVAVGRGSLLRKCSTRC